VSLAGSVKTKSGRFFPRRGCRLIQIKSGDTCPCWVSGGNARERAKTGAAAMPETRSPSPLEQQMALWLSTIAFTLCFAVWTIFSIIGVTIKRDLGLSELQYGVLIATPILTGSLVRLILGV